MPDRNVQYGQVAVRNNWITQEQFAEILSLHSKLQARDPRRRIPIEKILIEKGLISEVQHQAVLSVLERMDIQDKQRTAAEKRLKRATNKNPRSNNMVKCPHCGALNPRGVEECGQCQGYIPPTDDDGGVDLLEKATCPSCQRGIEENAQECVCGALFCPNCRGVRTRNEPICRHCGITIPGMERVAAARAAAMASGAIKVKKSGPVATHMPPWVGPTIIGVIVVIFYFALSGGREEIDLEAYRAAQERIEGFRSEADIAIKRKDWREARKQFKRAMSTARELRNIAQADESRSQEATAEIESLESALARVDRLAAAEQRKTTSGSASGDDSGGDPGGDPDGDSGTVSGGDVGGTSGEASGGEAGGEEAGGDPGGASGGDTQPRGPAVLPEDMTPERRQEVLKELAALKLKLPEPPAVDDGKLILLFRRRGSEVVGELIDKNPSRYLIRTFDGKRLGVSSTNVLLRVEGQRYHRGPEITQLMTKRGVPYRGKPERVTRSGKLLFARDGDSSIIVRPEQVAPRDYYRAMRWVKDAKTPEDHLFLAQLCIDLGLADQARREFWEVARGGDEHALIAMPYLRPDDFLAWWLRRESDVEELRALAEWGLRALGARDRARVLRRAVKHPDLERDVELQTAYVKALMEAGMFDEAQEHLESLTREGPEAVKLRASTMLRELETTRKRLEAELRRNKKGRVAALLLEELDKETDDIATEEEFLAARNRILLRLTRDALLRRVAKQLEIDFADALDGFRQRYQLAAVEPHFLEYGGLTWLVDTPGAMYFGLGTERVNELKQAHWKALAPDERKGLLRSMFIEAHYNVIEVTREPLPGAEKAEPLDNYRRGDAIENLPPEKRAGYHRVVKAR